MVEGGPGTLRLLRTMEDQTYFNAISGIAVVAVLVVAAVLFVVAPGGSPPTRTVGPGPSGPTVYRNLTISYDTSIGGFVYDRTVLEVPMNVRVIFAISNLDPSVATLPTVADAVVTGTIG